MAIKRIVFVRPGETDWNLQGRMQGWVAAPLNDHGRMQVQRLASFLRHIGLSALYASDLKRSRETAAILAAGFSFEPVHDTRFRERHIGYWQGLNVPEIHGWYQDEYQQLVADPENYEVPGGEARSVVRKRVSAGLKEIIDTWKKKTEETNIGIIAHTETIRLMLETLLPDSDFSEAKFGNTGVTTVVLREGKRWELVTLDDDMHLEGLESRYMPRVDKTK